MIKEVKLSKNQTFLIRIAIIFLITLVARHFLVEYICTGVNPCPLKVAELPLFLATGNYNNLLIFVIFVLFSLPFGYSSVVGTIIGLELGLQANITWPALILLYSLASVISIVLTYSITNFLINKFSHNSFVKVWRKKVDLTLHFASKFTGRFGIFAGLAIFNSVFSLIYASVFAVILQVPYLEAICALFIGNLISFAFAALIVAGVKLTTQDALITIIAATTILIIAHHVILPKK